MERLERLETAPRYRAMMRAASGGFRLRGLSRRTIASLCVCGIGAAWTIARGVTAAPASAAQATVVEAIFPTADTLPANLLRLYVVFSAPMSIGESPAHLQLLDDAGREVAGAFLRLDEELWDPTRRRLTVLVDPGRVKRGLRANLESGAPLVEGRRYRLVVEREWQDGKGLPLQARFEKRFVATAADRGSPDLAGWRLAEPRPSTRDPLTVRFAEPLDRALLAHALTIHDPRGAVVRGEIVVGREEREWTLVPSQPWMAGKHTLRVAGELEDVAGNSLQRVFDRDLTHPGERASNDAASVYEREFFVLPSSE
jgi:hypothetical protein